jgi:hypothetical protein
MRGRISRNEPTNPTTKVVSDGLFIDFPESHLEPVRRGRRPAPDPGEDAVAVSHRINPDGTEPQQVGGRRRFRPEFVLMLAGSFFLVAALLKPWSSALPARSPATGPIFGPTDPASVAPAGPVAEAKTPAPTAWQSPVGWPDVPQWDYGWPVSGASQPQTGSGIATDPRWTAVDWTVLGSLDPHDSWGYGTASMQNLAQLPASATAPSPVTTWVPAGAPRYTTINVSHGSQVFGLAVTWPHGIEVRSVTVGYIGGPEHPANMPPAGFPAYAQVSPLPAAQVASSPAADLGAGAAASPTQGAVGAAGTLGSGQFWIAPSGASSGPASASITSAWRSQPWPWPDGIYTITITSTVGADNYLLALQTN